MKKILIIEDNQIVANVYRNRLVAGGFQTEVALDGETGLEMMRTLHPDLMLLDLMLPKMSGVEVIKTVRGEADFAKLPIIVFSNTYLTNLIQEAWKAGANKCLSKTNCSPHEILGLVRQIVGAGVSAPASRPSSEDKVNEMTKVESLTDASARDTAFQADLRNSFIEELPGILAALRESMQSVISERDEMTRLKQIYALGRRLHALTWSAGIAGLIQISRMSDAVEALVKELYEEPKNVNASTLRTVADGVDVLGFLFEHGAAPEQQIIPAGDVLVVDDEPISRRAIAYALEKARLQSVGAEDPNAALKLLEEKHFDLVILDVGLPGMTGFELCARLRALPKHGKTAVVFVTVLSEFDECAGSKVPAGDDIIAKPFLFIELTVKALIHVLRARLASAKETFAPRPRLDHSASL